MTRHAANPPSQKALTNRRIDSDAFVCGGGGGRRGRPGAALSELGPGIEPAPGHCHQRAAAGAEGGGHGRPGRESAGAEADKAGRAGGGDEDARLCQLDGGEHGREVPMRHIARDLGARASDGGSGAGLRLAAYCGRPHGKHGADDEVCAKAAGVILSSGDESAAQKEEGLVGSADQELVPRLPENLDSRPGFLGNGCNQSSCRFDFG
jgi:hypothetical protein